MAAESASLLWSGVGPAEAAANVLRAPQHGPQVSCDWLAGLVLTSHWFTATPGRSTRSSARRGRPAGTGTLRLAALTEYYLALLLNTRYIYAGLPRRPDGRGEPRAGDHRGPGARLLRGAARHHRGQHLHHVLTFRPSSSSSSPSSWSTSSSPADIQTFIFLFIFIIIIITVKASLPADVQSDLSATLHCSSSQSAVALFKCMCTCKNSFSFLHHVLTFYNV